MTKEETKILTEKIGDLSEKVTRIESMLKYNGIGLIPTFEQHCNQDRDFRNDYFQFKKKVIAVFFFVLGGSGIGFGAFNLLP